VHYTLAGGSATPVVSNPDATLAVVKMPKLQGSLAAIGFHQKYGFQGKPIMLTAIFEFNSWYGQ
jgi:hypothetical protein